MNINFGINSKIVPKDFVTPSIKPRRRSSIFNVPPLENEKQEENELQKMYQKKLQDENTSWVNLIKKTNLRNKQLYNNKITLDTSILAESQLDFVKKRVDAKKFVKEHEEFANTAYRYLHFKEEIIRRSNFTKQMIEDIIHDKTMEVIVESIHK